MPRPSKETQDALNAIPGSHRAKCTALDFHWSWRGTIGRILKGSSISLENENEVRRRLGLAPILPPTIPVPACPDCGSVHHARCNGNGGHAVVLAPGETVRRQRGPWQSKAKPEVAAMVRGLERALERKQHATNMVH